MGRKDNRNWNARGQWGSSNGGSTSGKSNGRAKAFAILFVIAGATFVLSPFVYIITHQ